MKHTKQIQISLTQIARVYLDEHPTNPNDINDEIIIIYKRGNRAIEHPDFNLQDIRNHNATLTADKETHEIYHTFYLDKYFIFPLSVKGSDTIEIRHATNFDEIHGYGLVNLASFDSDNETQNTVNAGFAAARACKVMAAYSNGEMYRVEIINLETCPHCNHTKEEVGDSYGGFVDEAAAIEFIETNFLIL